VTADLDVYLYERRVGQLHLDPRHRFVFQYDRAWLAAGDALPLSLALPAREQPYADDEAKPFFANLLPESGVRRVIAHRLGISENNDYALLEAIGGECAGAVTVLPAGTELAVSGEYRCLTDDDLIALVESLPGRPFLAGEAGVRLSLAGAQNKLPVYMTTDSICLPTGAYPSSHILKPDIPDYEDTVINEAFCMRLAAGMGLSVPEVEVRFPGHLPVYIVQRYDREFTDQGSLVRIHQEDFCQALGVPPDAKYEKEGGPGLAPCFALIRNYSTQPAADVKKLLVWVIFNYLIGNADAHAKNISLLLPEEGPRLAPFYDLMCTAVYPELTDRLAMSVGGKDDPKWIIGRYWERFAGDIGVKPRLVKASILDMAYRIVKLASELKAGFATRYGVYKVVQQICDVIEYRSQKLQTAFDAAS
jgi:serine/threonine-protein kinase HipA